MEKILGIMMKGWDEWGETKGSDNITGLAKLTKGYGGADWVSVISTSTLVAVTKILPGIMQRGGSECSTEALLANLQVK